MRKFSLELPKYRLQLHFKLIKRRKPLLSEPLVPTPRLIRKKYRSGTVVGKVARHISEHKSVGKVFAANMALFIVASTFLPGVKASTNYSQPDETVIEVQNPIDTEKGLQLPLQTYRLNQGYNFFHPAVDLGANVGDPVEPIKSGVVTYAGFSYDGYGNHIVIDHGKGLTSLYAHLSTIEVKQGQTVTTKSEIGKVGMTGHTTGPHLHLEILENGVHVNPLNIIPR